MIATRATVDTAGGIIGPTQAWVRIDGLPWATVGSAVASHGSDAHAAATMIEGATFLKIDGIPVCHQGNAASCGHVSTGSGPVRVT